MPAPWEQLLDRAGLTLRAWLPLSALAPRPDDLIDGAQAVWLIGSPGQAMWEAFQAHLKAHPGWDQRAHPLDDFVDHILSQARLSWEQRWGLTQLYVPSRPVSYDGTRGFLDFLALAAQAGWGTISPLGMAVHRRYGPWFGLRGVVVTTTEPPQLATPTTASVCLSCDAPCVDACPAAAVHRDYFDVEDCSGYRLAGNDCQERCHARLACPVGAEFQYAPAQLAFHMRHALKLMQHMELSEHHEGTD